MELAEVTKSRKIRRAIVKGPLRDVATLSRTGDGGIILRIPAPQGYAHDFYVRFDPEDIHRLNKALTFVRLDGTMADAERNPLTADPG